MRDELVAGITAAGDLLVIAERDRRREAEIAQRFYALGEHLHDWQEASDELRERYCAAARSATRASPEGGTDAR